MGEDNDFEEPRSRSGKLGALVTGTLLGVVIGIALCWYVLPKEGEPNSGQTAKTQIAAQDNNADQQKELSQQNNVETMTPSEMTESLRKARNEDFERQYLVYAIQLGNYTTALNLIGKERAEREELAKFTTLMHGTSDDITKQLYGWQSAWGHTDH